MGTDEEGTLGRLKALRADVIDPKLTEHHGRIAKTTGDGLLVEFGSVVDALRCAIEIQAALAESNAPLPADKRIDFRIGIHQGDIVVEDGDIFGDGVRTSQRGWKAWPSRAAFVSRRGYARTRRGKSTSLSKIGRAAAPQYFTTSARLRGWRNCGADAIRPVPDWHRRPCCGMHPRRRCDRDSGMVGMASLQRTSNNSPSSSNCGLTYPKRRCKTGTSAVDCRSAVR